MCVRLFNANVGGPLGVMMFDAAGLAALGAAHREVVANYVQNGQELVPARLGIHFMLYDRVG